MSNNADDSPLNDNLQAGSFSVTVYDNKNCYIDTTFEVGSTLSLATPVLSDFVIYPNPAQSQIAISLPAAGDVALYTSEGRLVFKGHSNSSKTQFVNTSLFESGIYTVVFINPKGESLSKQLIISK